MSKLEYRKMTDEEVRSGLESLAGWSIEGDQIAKQFTFGTYKDGVVFATAVAYLADKLNHHPDLLIGYAKVRVGMNTHDVKGLSPYDFELARRIDAI